MKIHFISIGGSAMHNLAIALHNAGHSISGSDDMIFEPSKSRLEKYSLLPSKMGWDESNINNQLDAVILGMHAKDDNPELIKARELNLKIYSYPEFLYQSSIDKTRVVVGGSHGKTTITSMILHALHTTGRQVDYMVGAQLEGFEVMVKLDKNNKHIVLEGDEYLSSALDLRPKFHLYKAHIALLSGIAWDHINVFPTFDIYLEQFKIFIEQIQPGGSLIYNSEDENICKLVEESKNKINFIPYSTPNYRVENQKCVIESHSNEYSLEVFGKHNLQNLEGAKHVCISMGMEEGEFYRAISTFKGASRRLELVKDTEKHKVYKDFAHSPSKVKASVSAILESYPNLEKLIVLELHTFSSLNPEFLKLYKDSLSGTDSPVVYVDKNIVANKRMKAIDDKVIKESFAQNDIVFFDDQDMFKAYVLEKVSQVKLALFMSSGNLGGLNINNL